MKIILILFVTLVSGCASTYKQSDLQSLSTNLDRSRGVLISVPEDGWYDNTQYHNSGKMTVNSIRAAFVKNTSRVDIINSCHGDECLETIDLVKYGYYIKPDILHWEERSTEWSGKPDIIEIQIVVFDSASKEEIANSTYTGKSKWATFGGDHPQDLLSEPTLNYINSLYE